MHEAGHPKPWLCDNLEGWDGDGVEGGFRMEGTHVYLWPIHIDILRSISKNTKYLKKQKTYT